MPPWAAAKFIAALQEAQQQSNLNRQNGPEGCAPYYLLPRESGGHFGHEQQYYMDRAYEYAFVVAACEGSVLLPNMK